MGPRGARLAAGDDTVNEHRGAKVYGKGCHRDPVRSTHSYTAFRWGHKWVVLAILVPFPFATRAWALPVLVALYHSPQKATKAKAPAAKRRRKKAKDKTKVQAKERARRKAAAQAQAQAKTPKKTKAPLRRRHKTPSELMRQLLLVLTHWFPDRQFVFAGDGGYGTHALARFAARRRRRNLTLVSLFYANAALHDPPPVVVGKKTSHPPQEGNEAARPRGGRGRDRARRQPLEVSWYGGGRRTVEVVSGTGHWHKSGEGLVEVFWVFVHDLTGTHRDSYLFSTDPAMPVARVIATYTGRWNIETTFQEMRAYLGLETTRGRTKNTVLRAAPCLFGLYSVVALLYAELPAEATAEATVSYRGKAAVTFSDAISVVRRQLWLEGVFESHGQTEAFETSRDRCRRCCWPPWRPRREPRIAAEPARETALQRGRSQAQARRSGPRSSEPPGSAVSIGSLRTGDQALTYGRNRSILDNSVEQA